MPRKPEDNDRIRVAARDKIQSAAMEIFIEKGYHHATMEDIAQQAGISKGLPYNYFKGKEEVLSEMVAGRIQEIRMVMATAVSLGSPQSNWTTLLKERWTMSNSTPKRFVSFCICRPSPKMTWCWPNTARCSIMKWSASSNCSVKYLPAWE